MGTVVNAPEPTLVWLSQRALSVRHRPGAPGAEPAVMIHGLGGSSLNWTDLMAGLSDRLDSSAVDLAGFGESPPPRDGDFSPPGQARGVAELIQEKHFGPVHLFGNSLGGAVALQLAARYPELIRSLTLISPALPRLLPTRETMHMPIIALPGVGDRLLKRYGRVDRVVNSVAAHRATRHFPNAHVVTIPDSGHVAQIEHPELVERAWRHFIGR